MNYLDAYMYYKQKYKEQKKRINVQTGGKFVMFTKKERINIMKNYNDIIKGDKKCEQYPMNKVMKGAKGMYVYPKYILKEKGKKELCGQMYDGNKKKQEPIVHENSMTAWGNYAAEKYGLEIRDIIKMKPGQKMKVLLLDRNVGDYMHGTKKGTKYDPKKKGLSYATYTHTKGLTGKLDMYDVGVIHDPFTWEINSKSIGGSFWCPIDCAKKDVDIMKLNPRTKVGWRGPAIRKVDAKYLPKNVVHYDTWWDDYMPFRYQDFLKS